MKWFRFFRFQGIFWTILSLGIGCYSAQAADTTIVVPTGGNTWCIGCESTNDLVTAEGIQNWTTPHTTFDTWIRVSRPGSLEISVEAATDKTAEIGVSMGKTAKKLVVRGHSFKIYPAAKFSVQDTGYICITLKAIQRTGLHFADVKALHISGTAINNETRFVKNNAGNFFYWGRRGPSVHLNYPFADSIQAEWFYNEVTVPVEQDVIGSYFMANGFGEGYFGIQVNAPTERRILFSVWSPFSTDDPQAIPDSMKIVLLKKGEDVQTGEFGNEGSGGQSFLRYNWKAGIRYRFLLQGRPVDEKHSIYTAYFFDPEQEKWRLIASFSRPKTTTWLKRLHSFLENFIPEQGNQTREVLFGNQWLRTSKGEWMELTSARFTYDNTAAQKYRMDYGGGVKGTQFYLKNGGFFNAYTAYRAVFLRAASQLPPEIDFSSLP